MLSLPKVTLVQLPTPLHRLEEASNRLGIELWIKRDDLTGFAMGGNKGRKLEYIVADALSQQADVVVTCGAAQSNFIRQLGAACAKHRLGCAAAVMALPFEHDAVQPVLDSKNGNVRLSRLLGVDLRESPNGTWDELYEQAETIAREYEEQGSRVYRIPIGGSAPLGAYGFVQAASEVQKQENGFDWVVTASSSGSTQVGLSHGYRHSKTKVFGIVSDPEPEIVHDFANLSRGLAPLIGHEPITAEEFLVSTDYVGSGYGIPSEAGDAAIEWLAKVEGIFLDPIYSGKAFAGLLDLVKKGGVGGKVLFWHTGGLPALFAR